MVQARAGGAGGEPQKRRSVEHRFGGGDGAAGGKEIVIDDPAVLRALFGPLRHRLMGLLDQPTAAKELADQLGVPTGRLYYHLDILTNAGLVEVADQRVVGTNVERLFRRSADRFVLSDELARSPFAVASAVSQLDESVQRALADLKAPVPDADAGAGDNDGDVQRHVRKVMEIELDLDADQAEALAHGIDGVVAEFRKKTTTKTKTKKKDGQPRTQTYGLLVLLAPRVKEGR